MLGSARINMETKTKNSTSSELKHQPKILRAISFDSEIVHRFDL